MAESDDSMSLEYLLEKNDVFKSNQKSKKKRRSAKSALPVTKRPRLDTADVEGTSTDNSGNDFFFFSFIFFKGVTAS